MGRHRKPTAVKILEGNPGKRPLPKDEPKPEPLRRDLKPPAVLNEYGKAEWIRISPILRGLGLLTRADLPALTLYCAAWGRWQEAEEQLAAIQKASPAGATALLQRTPNGHAIPNPLLSVARQHAELAIKVLSLFGMTPVDRAKVSAGIPAEPPEGGEEALPAPAAEDLGHMEGLIGAMPRRPN